jgi:hypothetical protein
MEILEKIDSDIYVEMTFDTMCKRVEKSKLVALGNEEFFKQLPF